MGMLQIHSTPLHHAVSKGDANIVSLLVEAGADIEARTGYMSNKETPLLIAARRGHKEIVSILLEAGADIEAVDKVRSSTKIMSFSILSRRLNI